LFSWYDVITCKSKKSSGAQFQMLFLKIVLFFDVPQYLNRFDDTSLKTDDEQFTLTTKKVFHITFNNSTCKRVLNVVSPLSLWTLK